VDNPKTIASLISENVAVSPARLLYEFVADHENIDFQSFQDFCLERGILIESHEFLDLLATDPTYLFQEYSDTDGRYWVPALPEGYIQNSLPGDWDDFGDDQIEGITKPTYGAVVQPDIIDFEPLNDTEEEEADLPDFDEIPRRRPSRNPAELEGLDIDGELLLEEDNSLIARLHQLVDVWQNGTIDQQTFEWRLGQLVVEQPSLRNHVPDVWAMVRKMIAARAKSSTKI